MTKSVEDISLQYPRRVRRLLVVCSKGKYLDGSDTWSEYEKAWHVVMVLPGGRKIAVSRKDFEASS